MFEEDFEAWEFGPVIPVIYKKYSKYKKNHIADVSDDYSADVFTDQELETLIDVANYYGRYSTAALVDKTHLRNGPWDVTLQNRKSIINKESIKEFYKNEVPLDSFDIPKWMYDSAEEGYRNSEGVKVFKRD